MPQTVQIHHEVAKNKNFIAKEASQMVTSRAKFERPTSIKTCLFQLNERSDLSRIIFLLDAINNQYLDKIEQLFKSETIDKYN